MKNMFIYKIGISFSAIIILLLLGCENKPNGKETTSAQEHHEDMGKKPWVLDIEKATIANSNYRIAKWSGENMQMVLMSLAPGEIIDLEIHDGHDQFIRIEQGEARVFMGEKKDDLSYEKDVSDDWAVFIPAGFWHQVRNTGRTDLKLYTIYAPSEHRAGTIHETYEKAIEKDHGH